MALSRDRGTHKQAVDQGYGLVCDEQGQLLTGWTLSQANQEHGIVSLRDGQSPVGDVAKRFPIGSRLRVLPNHACATGAQHEAYAVLRAGEPSASWPRFNGW